MYVCEENRHIKYNSRSCCEQIITAIMCISPYETLRGYYYYYEHVYNILYDY